MNWRITTRTEAEALRALLDLAHGPYPKRGTFTVAPGKTPRRVPQIQETWDGSGPAPVGWTAHHVEILDDPAQPGTSAVRLPPVDEAKESILTAQQRAQLIAARAGAVAQRPEWVVTLQGGGKRTGDRT